MSNQNHASPSVNSRRLLGLVPVLLALPILVWHASYYMPYMSDDSLIVARYAERLIEGHGLTWTDGERVEGYSNLLWTVCIAAIGALGIDILDAARLLGITCMAAVLLAISRAHAPQSFAEVVPPTVAALMFASAGPVAVWAIGGLEQSMVAALLAWALVVVFPIVDGTDQSSRRALLVGLPLGLLCWTRPDGPLFTAVFASVIVLQFRLRRPGWVLGLRMTLLPVLAVALQLGVRLIYYDDWLPNPAYIKARVVSDRLPDGFEYIVGAWEWMVPALVLVGLSLVVSFVGKHQRGRSILLLCCFFAWASYVVAIGGDIFAGRRHWVPLWLLLSFLVVPGLDWVIRRERVWLTLVVALTSLAAVGWLGKLQLEDPKVQPAKEQTYQWEGEVLARVLGEGFRAEQPLLAVTAAGTLPYFSKLPSLDMLGLNDRHIARQRPERAGELLAHDHADGGYVLDREPDLIVFNLGVTARYEVGNQMLRDERFKRDYMMVLFRGYEPHERSGKVYVRTRGRVGMQVENDAVSVPGYLLQGDGVYAQPGVDGGIETVIPAHAKLRAMVIPLAPGTWRVTTVPPNPNVDLGLYVGKQRPTNVLSVTGGEEVRLRAASRDISSLLGMIRIERVADDSKSSPEPASHKPPNYTVEPFGTFEDGLGSWRTEGPAFNNNPTSRKRKRQSPITGNVGNFLNSFNPKRGDRVKGQLTSEPFTVTAGTVLSFRVGGGKHLWVGVRLMVGDRPMMTWHGADSETLEEVRFALTPYAGWDVHVEVYDDLLGSWGHVLADEFVLLHPAASEPNFEPRP
jgi:arabinofuranosyltransferase